MFLFVVIFFLQFIFLQIVNKKFQIVLDHQIRLLIRSGSDTSSKIVLLWKYPVLKIQFWSANCTTVPRIHIIFEKFSLVGSHCIKDDGYNFCNVKVTWIKFTNNCIHLKQLHNNYNQNQLWMLCGSITSNTGSDANGDSHICADCHRHFRQNRGNNQHLISCSNSSSLIFKHHWKEIKTLQMIEHLMIQILRFYIYLFFVYC